VERNETNECHSYHVVYSFVTVISIRKRLKDLTIVHIHRYKDFLTLYLICPVSAHKVLIKIDRKQAEFKQPQHLLRSLAGDELH
jgi:hypothetical protein